MALVPFAHALLALGGYVHPYAVLLPLVPLASEESAVSPQEGAFTLLQVVDVLALVGPPVWPLVSTPPVHLVGNPLARVLPLVLPAEGPLALHGVIYKVTLVRGTIRPFKLPIAMLLAILVATSVLGVVIYVLLDSLAVLLVVAPLTDIPRLARQVRALAMRFPSSHSPS